MSVILPRTIPAALKALTAARWPEAVFGHDAACVQDQFRAWAKIVHEDRATAAQKPQAHEAFLLLTKLHDEALSKIGRGTYGDCRPTVTAVLRTKTVAYSLTSLIRSDDISDLYEATSDGAPSAPLVVKVVRDPRNNDLMKNEADVLASVPAKLAKPEHAKYFPDLRDSFEAAFGKVKRRVNVFALTAGSVSLRQVRTAYPAGLDVKDAAWMWNRQLEALHLLHCQGYVHGAVTPDRFYIVPSTHEGFLVDFCCTVKAGQKVRAISPAWRQFYPAEVAAKVPVDFSSDLFMSASCMAYLLGATTRPQIAPNGTPLAIAGLMRSCWLGKAHRGDSAKQLYSDFKEVRKGLRWKKEFRPFALPVTDPA